MMIVSIIAAIIPIVAILLIGKLAARAGLLTAEGWLGLEAITYYVLFPALIVSKLAVADFATVDWRMPVTLIAAQIIMTIASIALAKLQDLPGERIGVMVQSGVRWNTFIALALAQDLMGDRGIVLVAAAAAAMVPTANLLSIVALSRYADQQLSARRLLWQVLTNPLIIASIVGLAINALGLQLWAGVTSVLDILSQGAIALGLLASGAYVQVRHIGTSISVLIGWSMFRLLGLPLAAGVLAAALSLAPEILLAVLISTAVPTASNGAMLARKLGGDATLAANLIAFQTVLAIISFAAVLTLAELLRLI